MRLVKNKKTGRFDVHFYAGKIRGHTIVSTHCTNQTDALKVAYDAKIKEIELAARADVMTQEAVNLILRGKQKCNFTTLASQWKNWMEGVRMSKTTAYAGYIEIMAFGRFSGMTEKNPSEITDEQISAYVNRPSDAKVSTREKSLSRLRCFFDWLRNNNHVSTNVARLVRGVQFDGLTHEQKEPLEKNAFTDEEVDLVLEACKKKGDDFFYAATLISRHTALRLGDICHLEWASIKDKLTVWTGKTDKRIELDISKIDEFLHSIPKDDERYVFPHERRTCDDPEMRACLSSRFSWICRKCGINKSFHDLRRMKLTQAASESGIKEAQRIAGHWSVKQTEKYVSTKI